MGKEYALAFLDMRMELRQPHKGLITCCKYLISLYEEEGTNIFIFESQKLLDACNTLGYKCFEGFNSNDVTIDSREPSSCCCGQNIGKEIQITLQDSGVSSHICFPYIQDVSEGYLGSMSFSNSTIILDQSINSKNIKRSDRGGGERRRNNKQKTNSPIDPIHGIDDFDSSGDLDVPMKEKCQGNLLTAAISLLKTPTPENGVRK